MKKFIFGLALILSFASASAYTVTTSKFATIPTDVAGWCNPGVCHTHSDGVYWCH